ncbi:MAG: hypothetical protein WC928_03505 [Patescibacteria group bacterium]|jgi:phage-related protein
MKIVYYYDENLKFCPVKEYFKNYLLNENDSDSVIRRKQKILADIDAKINYIKDNGARPIPPISKPLRGYSFFEILSPKDFKTVIRILYFRYQDKMVLLHVFEKPASYSTNREKKRVNEQNKIADSFLDIFKLNLENYEEY